MKIASKLKTQVIVVGSGAAGINAAIASARNGAETILIERDGYLGGVSASLGWIGFHDQDYRQIVKGIPHEIVENLWSKNAASRYQLDIKMWFDHQCPLSSLENISYENGYRCWSQNNASNIIRRHDH